MIERDRLCLGHMLAAIDDIADFTSAGREAFMSERKTQSAVIRQPEIIGEAVKRLSQELTQAETAVPWRSIAGARGRLIHGYFSMDLDAVWTMVAQDLPTLRAQMQRIAGLPPRHPLPPP